MPLYSVPHPIYRYAQINNQPLDSLAQSSDVLNAMQTKSDRTAKKDEVTETEEDRISVNARANYAAHATYTPPTTCSSIELIWCSIA